MVTYTWEYCTGAFAVALPLMRVSHAARTMHADVSATALTMIRFGGSENLYGYDAIQAFRAARSPAGLARRLDRTVITTFQAIRHMPPR